MYHVDLSKKRTQIALRFFSYGVMAVATAVLSILAIYYAMGFRFNRNLTIEQGGVVQFRSTPDGARVFTDGQQRDNTPSRAYLSAGQHTVEMQRDGYRNWQKNVSLTPGQLLWLDYTRFIPNVINTTAQKQFDGVVASLSSPDRRWLLVQDKLNSPVMTLVDLADEELPQFKELAVSDAKLTKKDAKLGNFSLIEWSLDSRHFLVRHNNQDIDELIWVDREKPEAAINLSQLFRLDIGKVHFAGNNPNILYAQTGDVLRRLDVGSNSASAALVTDVTSFVLYGAEDVAFVAERELDTALKSRKQIVGTYRGGKETTIRSFELGKPITIDLTEYFRHRYLAINTGDAQVEIIKDPAEGAQAETTSVTLNLDEPATWLKFSGNGRMLVAGAKKTWATYDLEIAEAYKNQVPSDLASPLEWLDDFHLWIDVGGNLKIVEFDGQNASDITQVAPGFNVSLSPNGQSLFSFSPVKDSKLSLQSSRLIVEN